MKLEDFNNISIYDPKTKILYSIGELELYINGSTLQFNLPEEEETE